MKPALLDRRVPGTKGISGVKRLCHRKSSWRREVQILSYRNVGSIAALALNPNLAGAWWASGWARVYCGEPEAAIEYFARAMRLSPLDPHIMGMQVGTAFAHMLAGRYDEASCGAAKAMWAQNYVTPLRIAVASHALAGRLAEAKRRWPGCGNLIHLRPSPTSGAGAASPPRGHRKAGERAATRGHAREAVRSLDVNVCSCPEEIFPSRRVEFLMYTCRGFRVGRDRLSVEKGPTPNPVPPRIHRAGTSDRAVSQCDLMPANLITLPHFSVSSAISLPNVAG